MFRAPPLRPEPRLHVYTFEGGQEVAAYSLNAARRQLAAPAAAVRCTLNGVDQWPPGYSVPWPDDFA